MTYPLESVRIVRTQARDEARHALAKALEHERAASDERERRVAALRTFDRDERARRETEDRRLASSATGAELDRAQRYRQRRDVERGRLQNAVDAAASAERRARAAVEDARRSLERAEAELEVLERHRERHDASARRTAERKHEDERDDENSSRAFRDA